MPQRKQPITQRPKVEDPTVEVRERHGPHRDGDEALSGKGSRKGGMDKSSGASRSDQPTRGVKHSREPARQSRGRTRQKERSE